MNSIMAGIRANEIDHSVVMAAVTGRGKSTYIQDWLARQPKFYRVYILGYEGTDVTCDAQQEVQDWLMREFDPATMWEYTTTPHRADRHLIQTGFDRVTMREEVFLMLSLRWS